MQARDRIEVNPKVMLDKPVIRGTRIPVELLLRKLVVRQSSFDRVSGEDFASLARRSDAGVAGPTSRRSNAASGVKDRQDSSNEG
jgi:hypothetical protein